MFYIWRLNLVLTRRQSNSFSTFIVYRKKRVTGSQLIQSAINSWVLIIKTYLQNLIHVYIRALSIGTRAERVCIDKSYRLMITVINLEENASLRRDQKDCLYYKESVIRNNWAGYRERGYNGNYIFFTEMLWNRKAVLQSVYHVWNLLTLLISILFCVSLLWGEEVGSKYRTL